MLLFWETSNTTEALFFLTGFTGQTDIIVV
jgi:hypothetical protein